MSSSFQFPALLTSVKLNLKISSFAELIPFLKGLPKLQKLNIINWLNVEESMETSWFQLITEYLPVLIEFKLTSSVASENVIVYLQSFRWSNTWHMQEKIIGIRASSTLIKILLSKL
ncbi:unnamed protein product [Rotaria sp. Silwood2]|nr:unnamed protein product [Rotaria sp. Silwood2]CAF3096858.1 unnamed protein product [Rotaria sp. Silwood2]CAF3329931.1 unnamed protein product [Rotaria sp. Silwood2]CAF4148716.1 unnamed protein product [Rotaria sp. Silwood2]CAF4360979.1 unnamed protein product [Rotaria sp. Silwood2]